MKCILFILLFFIGATAFAQNEVGIKGGLNYVNVIEKIQHPEPLVNYNSNTFSYRPAFHFGFYGKFNWNEDFAFYPELLYSLKGATRSANGQRETYSFHYLSIPLMISYEPIEKISFLLGPEVGVLLANAVKGNPTITKLDYMFLNTLEVGAALGMQLRFTEKVNFGLRYTYSFNSALANMDVVLSGVNGQQSGSSTLYYKNSTFQLSLGYKLFGSEAN